MQTNQTLPDGIINPFSDNFLTTWQLWKEYKWEAHKFKYKGCISEQLALIQLAEKADKDEQTAIAIVKQSIENQWAGLFRLKTIKIKNGTERKPTVEQNHSELNDLYNKRFGKTG